MLLIKSDDDAARSTFRRTGEVYWTAALALALEKHGHLDVRVTGPAALHDPVTWRAPDVVLVSRAHDVKWTEETVRSAASGRPGVIVEGPLPPPLIAAFGIDSLGPMSPFGTVSATDQRLYRDAMRYGHAPSARVEAATARPVDRDPDLEWAARGPVISTGRAEAWGRPGWKAERWTLSGNGERLAAWTTQEGERHPAVVRGGKLVGCCFSLFAYLGQRHTSEPFGAGEHRMSARSTGLETLLLALIDEAYEAAAASRLRVLPWPAGIDWVRTVRHDFDRPLDERATSAVLRAHDEAGTRATWYWRARHAHLPALSLVARHPDHEIALHTESLWDPRHDEKGVLERALRRPVKGTSAHGAPQSYGHQGAPNVLWAEEQRMDYTELLQHGHLHPHRFAGLREDGTIAPLRVLCLPHHQSLDRSTKPGDAYVDELVAAPKVWAAASGFLQVMNHPDLNQGALFRVLAGMPAQGRADWTAERAVDWWRRTHVLGALAVRGLGDGRFELWSAHGVDDIALEILRPTGEEIRMTISLARWEARILDALHR